MCHSVHYRNRDHETGRVERPTSAIRVTDADRETGRGGRPTGPVRVADADRERVVELLRVHAAAGRLDADELEERSERAYSAKYADELDAVLDELPPERAGARADRRRPSWPAMAGAFPLAVAALVAVAAMTGVWWLMWLIWPMAVMLGPRRHYRRHHRSA
jgi:DUF1707 SHOCT-like domain